MEVDMMEKGILQYLDENSEGFTSIKVLEIDYNLQHLDRIEGKLDSILERLEKMELSSFKD
jgi:hypothetical protein